MNLKAFGCSHQPAMQGNLKQEPVLNVAKRSLSYPMVDCLPQGLPKWSFRFDELQWCQMNRTAPPNLALASNALSIEFGKLARDWQSIAVSKRFDEQEADLASNCSVAIRKLKKLGLLSDLSDLLTEEVSDDPPEMFSFNLPGRDFYRLAGYCEIELGMVSDEDVRRVLKPGIFHQLVQTLDWIIEDSESFSLNSPQVMDAVFDKYQQICETISKAILDEGARPDPVDPTKNRSGSEQQETPKLSYWKKLSDAEKRCIRYYVSGLSPKKIDAKILEERPKAKRCSAKNSPNRFWCDGDAEKVVDLAKTRLLVPEPTAPKGWQLLKEIQDAEKLG
jgi:hypothetical protein